jgi:hypothetical protein
MSLIENKRAFNIFTEGFNLIQRGKKKNNINLSQKNKI